MLSAALAGAAFAAALGLAACASGGLPGGLTDRMDQPGARLDRAQALGILNQYRASVGAPVLAADAGLDATAETLAMNYARSGTAPQLPEGAVGLRVSAGYTNFAETFSGWRNSPADAAAIGDARARRAGIGVVSDPNSTYGVYWVLVLDD